MVKGYSKRKREPTISFDIEHISPEGVMSGPALHDIMKCLKCLYLWKPRVKKPKECPNCKSRSWNE